MQYLILSFVSELPLWKVEVGPERFLQIKKLEYYNQLGG